MNLKKSIILMLLATILPGCASYDKSIYLRDDEILEKAQQQARLYEYRVMPKDELTIIVSTSDPASSVPFYRKIGQGKDQASTTQGIGDAKLLNYLVDNNGYIDYPVLGNLKVEGLTARECEALIREKLQAYLSEVPNVTVRSANYKISVIGEVSKPGTYNVNDERINIFQALAQAGDMTLFADRDDVHLLREDSTGKRTVVHLDLTESDIVLSPYYYLQQNDIVYVKPTKTRVRSNALSSNGSIWISILGLITTITSLIVVAIK